MKNRNILILAIVFSLMVFSSLAQSNELQPAYDQTISPVDTLASYYDAIENHDYLRAYNYWETAPRPYEDFVNGFAETTSIQLIVEPPTRVGVAAGSAYAEIPTVLIADHLDGTQHTFAGCFITRRTNLQPPAVPVEDNSWHLYSARLIEVSNNASISALLEQSCSLTE